MILPLRFSSLRRRYAFTMVAAEPVSSDATVFSYSAGKKTSAGHCLSMLADFHTLLMADQISTTFGLRWQVLHWAGDRRRRFVGVFIHRLRRQHWRNYHTTTYPSPYSYPGFYFTERVIACVFRQYAKRTYNQSGTAMQSAAASGAHYKRVVKECPSKVIAGAHHCLVTGWYPSGVPVSNVSLEGKKTCLAYKDQRNGRLASAVVPCWRCSPFTLSPCQILYRR